MINDENKDLLKKYAGIKLQMRELEAELEKMKHDVKVVMTNEVGHKEFVNIPDIGNLSLRERPIWTFPNVIMRAEEDIKVAKKTAKANGDASCTVEYDVLFTVPKKV